MAYNDEALKAKLSTLNETQESIVSVSQWITFHRRYADRIAQVWYTRLRDAPPPKRLNYIYLVNDIVQNAKARKRAEFPNAFASIIAEAVQQAYRSSTTDIQNKIKRVIEVWKTRGVFEESILQAVQARIDDVDKSKSSSGKKTLMGNSLFSSSSGKTMPKELESLGPLQTAVTKADFTSRPLVQTAQTEYSKVHDTDTAKPSAPVHAANLSSLVKKLTGAEAGLNESITARKALIADLRRLLEAGESALVSDEATLADFSSKRTNAEADKRDVEDSIMKGLAATPQDDDEHTTGDDNRPDVEELTPEPGDFTIAAEQSLTETPLQNSGLEGILAGFGSEDTASTIPFNGSGPSSSKKRKLSHDTYTNNEENVPDLGAMGVTGYDGSYDNSSITHSTYDASSYTPVQPVGTEVPSLISTLEQDVDALIRGSSSGAAS